MIFKIKNKDSEIFQQINLDTSSEFAIRNIFYLLEKHQNLSLCFSSHTINSGNVKTSPELSYHTLSSDLILLSNFPYWLSYFIQMPFYKEEHIDFFLDVLMIKCAYKLENLKEIICKTREILYSWTQTNDYEAHNLEKLILDKVWPYLQYHVKDKFFVDGINAIDKIFKPNAVDSDLYTVDELLNISLPNSRNMILDILDVYYVSPFSKTYKSLNEKLFVAYEILRNLEPSSYDISMSDLYSFKEGEKKFAFFNSLDSSELEKFIRYAPRNCNTLFLIYFERFGCLPEKISFSDFASGYHEIRFSGCYLDSWNNFLIWKKEIIFNIIRWAYKTTVHDSQSATVWFFKTKETIKNFIDAFDFDSNYPEKFSEFFKLVKKDYLKEYNDRFLNIFFTSETKMLVNFLSPDADMYLLRRINQWDDKTIETEFKNVFLNVIKYFIKGNSRSRNNVIETLEYFTESARYLSEKSIKIIARSIIEILSELPLKNASIKNILDHIFSLNKYNGFKKIPESELIEIVENDAKRSIIKTTMLSYFL